MDLAWAINELKEVLGTLEVLDKKAEELLALARAYASDAGHFLDKGKREDALEAYSISWAYLDALLHMDLIDVKDYSLFTVER
jgi:hypothetical protein